MHVEKGHGNGWNVLYLLGPQAGVPGQKAVESSAIG